jgi:uncharacterized membrane protein YkvA (DUF1232 family)
MTDDQNRKVIRADSSFFDNILLYMKLVLRLMGDNRVNPFLKLLPIGSLVYLVFPLDFPGPIDDLAVVSMGVFMFIEFCPPDVVEEHKQAIRGVFTATEPGRQGDSPGFSQDDVIDAEYREE